MTWLPETAAGAGAFERVFALRPNLFAAWREFAELLWKGDRVDAQVLALCRRRLAELNGARVAPAGRTPPVEIEAAKLAELSEWWKSARFTETEQACLRFAELYRLDPGAIAEDDARPVVEALGEAGTVAFVEALAIFDGFTRFCAMLDVTEEGAT